MARGDYDGATRLAEKGREIQSFQAELEALQARWSEIRQKDTKTGSGRKSRTPLWNYYKPILRALIELGGEAKRAEIEPLVERSMQDEFLPGDRETNARGRERWQVMVRRARRHLVEEGWIEGGQSQVWRITPRGRDAAKAGGKKTASGA